MGWVGGDGMKWVLTAGDDGEEERFSLLRLDLGGERVSEVRCWKGVGTGMVFDGGGGGGEWWWW